MLRESGGVIYSAGGLTLGAAGPTPGTMSALPQELSNCVITFISALQCEMQGFLSFYSAGQSVSNTSLIFKSLQNATSKFSAFVFCSRVEGVEFGAQLFTPWCRISLRLGLVQGKKNLGDFSTPLRQHPPTPSSSFVALQVLPLTWMPTNPCSSVYQCCCCLVAKSCPTLCDPIDCSLSVSSVHGLSQARILE